jgi:hypothetical protein
MDRMRNLIFYFLVAATKKGEVRLRIPHPVHPKILLFFFFQVGIAGAPKLSEFFQCRDANILLPDQ